MRAGPVLRSAGPRPNTLRRSHGEGFLDFFRARLTSSLRSGRPSLFLFDEPESALAPRWQLELLRWLQEVERSGRGQVIIATHSPVLMAYPGAAVLRLRDGRVERVNVEAIDHFELLRAFFADPHGFVARELADPNE